jgi:hypothetical protein
MRVEFISNISYRSLVWYYCSECACTNRLRIEVLYKIYALRGARACIRPSPKVPHENFVTRFQCKRREIRHFQTIRNENLHENNIGVRVVNFATSKNVIVKSIMSPHCNIHNTLGLLMMGKRTIILIIS